MRRVGVIVGWVRMDLAAVPPLWPAKALASGRDDKSRKGAQPGMAVPQVGFAQGRRDDSVGKAGGRVARATHYKRAPRRVGKMLATITNPFGPSAEG